MKNNLFMKNKVLVIIIAAILIIGGAVGLGVYFMKKEKPINSELGPSQQETKPEGIGAITGENQNQNRIVAKDDFSLNAPKEWLEAGAPSGVSLMLVNNSEQTTNPAAKKINFRSYFSVSYDTLGENTKDKYMDILKNNLKQAIPEIVFSKESSLLIDGREAKALEAEISQQGVDFEILIFVISGKDKDVWIISFNTLREKWDNYKSLFYQIAESFKLKL